MSLRDSCLLLRVRRININVLYINASSRNLVIKLLIIRVPIVANSRNGYNATTLPVLPGRYSWTGYYSPVDRWTYSPQLIRKMFSPVAGHPETRRQPRDKRGGSEDPIDGDAGRLGQGDVVHFVQQRCRVVGRGVLVGRRDVRPRLRLVHRDVLIDGEAGGVIGVGAGPWLRILER